MNKKLILVLLLLGFVALFFGALWFYATFEGETAAPIPVIEDSNRPAESDAYDFHAEDQAGNPVQISDYLGQRPTIVYFWASWCTWCTRGMDELTLLYDEMGDTVQILAVNLPHLGGAPNELAEGRALMEARGFPFSSIYDVDGEAQALFSVTGVPRALFIDADGALVHDQLGFLDFDGLVGIVTQLN